MKFKKAFTVILMFSVFLSGCQRQVITGISENKNDVSTSANTPAPETTPTPTPMPTLTPIPSPTSTPAPTNTPAPGGYELQDKLKILVLFCPPLTLFVLHEGLELSRMRIISSLSYLFSFCMPPALSAPIVLTLNIISLSVPISSGIWFLNFSAKNEASTLSLILQCGLLALVAGGIFLEILPLVRG